jgi:hypothetical protein
MADGEEKKHITKLQTGWPGFEIIGVRLSIVQRVPNDWNLECP